MTSSSILTYNKISVLFRTSRHLVALRAQILKERSGAKDLAVRVALTNAYRHLFYPDHDKVKAPTGLKHYTLPAQESSTVKGKNNQQEVILKALRDCEKIRNQESPQPYAPAFILQKVWPAGVDNWTTKSLREAFAKDVNLKFLIDAEVSLLRDTIRKGLVEGFWDLKIGENLYIKTDTLLTPLLDTLEFSDRFFLYRRGILQPPQPKEIELSAQLMGENKVRVRWKAKGALKVNLSQDNAPIPGDFRPSDEYETTVDSNTRFMAIADYGKGEVIHKEVTVTLSPKVKENTTTILTGLFHSKKG